MEEKAVLLPPKSVTHIKLKLSAMLNDRTVRVRSLKFDRLPEILRRIAGDYISDDNKDCLKCALLDEQRITLCFSQSHSLKLGSCWRFGCLSSKDQWESSLNARIDKKYHVKDKQSCLDFLDRENSAYCPVVIEILVFQLDLSSKDLSNLLDDFKNIVTDLEENLSSVQHVVFAIDKYAFFCFSFNDVIGNATGLRQTVDRSLALKQIFDDLCKCWETNHTLSTKLLLDHFILSDVKPESDMYLSKFVILLNHFHNGNLFDTLDHTLKSSKLRWIYYLETLDDLKHFNRRIACRCHAFYLDDATYGGGPFQNRFFEFAFCFEDNPFINRIMIKSNEWGHTMNLPQPSDSLIDPMLHSALLELTLDGHGTLKLDLAQLNNGYFRNLAHLCVIDWRITGHLDSESLPCLKTLRIEYREHFEEAPSPYGAVSVQEHAQSLLLCGRPWQLVATQTKGGWSLASYDDPTANPQGDAKESAFQSSPRSLPMIVDLMLVASWRKNIDEWRPQLNGHPSLAAVAGDHSNRLLVWLPERVQKITAFCTIDSFAPLEFEQTIPEERRVLTALRCYNIDAVLDGAALPQLQSLELNDGWASLSGAFPRLKSLSVVTSEFSLPWQVGAPLLESLICDWSSQSENLTLNPQLLPHLSFLQITPGSEFPGKLLDILDDKECLGLARVKHVVFDRNMPSSCLDQCRVNRVSHLELAVNVSQLPACWSHKEWQCETLTIHVYSPKTNGVDPIDAQDFVVLPSLSLVKRMKVTAEGCLVLLDSEMPNLSECSMSSPKLLGPKLWCTALRCVRFTGKLSESDKKKCLDQNTYLAIGAQPKLVYFDRHGEVHKMTWDIAPN